MHFFILFGGFNFLGKSFAQGVGSRAGKPCNWYKPVCQVYSYN